MQICYTSFVFMDYKKVYTQDYFSGKTSFFYKFGYHRTPKSQFAFYFKTIEPYLKNLSGKKVLDVGCAYGFMLERFPADYEKFGVDVSDHAIAQAKKRLPGASFQLINTAERELPFPENFFDVVVCNDVIEHVEHPAHALQSIKRVLKKNGILYVSAPNLNWIRKTFFAYADRKENHISLMPHRVLEEVLIQNGFEVFERFTSTFFLKFKSNFGVESVFIARKKS